MNAHEKALQAAAKMFKRIVAPVDFGAARIPTRQIVEVYLAARPDLKRVPEGWRVVPAEATEKMLAAAVVAIHEHWTEKYGAQALLQRLAALAAAPEPEDDDGT